MSKMHNPAHPGFIEAIASLDAELETAIKTQGSCRQVRRREEADPPLTGRLPELSPFVMGQHQRAGATGSTVSLDEWLALLATHPMKGSQCGPFHWVNKADS